MLFSGSGDARSGLDIYCYHLGHIKALHTTWASAYTAVGCHFLSFRRLHFDSRAAYLEEDALVSELDVMGQSKRLFRALGG